MPSSRAAAMRCPIRAARADSVSQRPQCARELRTADRIENKSSLLLSRQYAGFAKHSQVSGDDG
jgi:hypothetical protein